MAIIHVSDSSFKKEVLEESLPVLVDLWAPWCGPCKMIAPALEELSKDFDGKIKICKINIDDNPNIPTQYQVMSIPTLMFFKKGQVHSQSVGALSKQELKKKIENFISNPS